MKRFSIPILVLGLGLGLSSCTTLAQWVGDITQFFSSSTPSQVSTLADAVAADTLVTMAIDVYVNTGTPNKATLQELQKINDTLLVALRQLEAASAAGQNLDYAAFNAALATFNSFATSQGIKH